MRIRLGLSLVCLCLAILLLSRSAPHVDAASSRAPVADGASADAAGVRMVGGALPANQLTPLTVEARDVTNLGAITAQVGYDPAQVRAVACRRNPVFAFGLCNLGVDRDTDGTADAVLFNLVSLTGQDAGAAALPLMDIVWEPVGSPISGTLSTLTIEVLTFSDTSGLPLGVTVENGQIRFVDQTIFKNYLPLLANSQPGERRTH